MIDALADPLEIGEGGGAIGGGSPLEDNGTRGWRLLSGHRSYGHSRIYRRETRMFSRTRRHRHQSRSRSADRGFPPGLQHRETLILNVTSRRTRSLRSSSRLSFFFFLPPCPLSSLPRRCSDPAECRRCTAMRERDYGSLERAGQREETKREEKKRGEATPSGVYRIQRRLRSRCRSPARVLVLSSATGSSSLRARTRDDLRPRRQSVSYAVYSTRRAAEDATTRARERRSTDGQADGWMDGRADERDRGRNTRGT